MDGIIAPTTGRPMAAMVAVGRMATAGTRYGIFSIPTMWLVDTDGNLRDTNARFNLERRVTSPLTRSTSEDQ